MQRDENPRDAIVDGVRRVRDVHAARFNYDLDAIVKDLKKQEARGREVVVLEPKRPERIKGAA